MRSWPAPSSRRRYGSRSRPGTRSPRTAPPDRRCCAPVDCRAAALSVWCARPRPFGAPAAGALAHRRCELQPALIPQRVQPPRDLQRRTLADVALERLAVIADLLDDAIG